MALGFQRLVARRYLLMQARRSFGVYVVPAVTAAVLLLLFAIDYVVAHAHWLWLAERRLELTNPLKWIEMGTAFAVVLLWWFVYLIRRYTIFTTISIYGLFLGSGALVIVLSVMSGFELDLKNKILGTNAEMVVRRSGDRPFTDYADALAKVRAVPGVIAAAPFLESEVMIASQSNLSGVAIKGIDPESVGRVTDLRRNIDVGSLEYLDSPDKLKLLGGPPLERRDDDDGEPLPPDAKHVGPADGKKPEAKKTEAKRPEAKKPDEGDALPPRRTIPGVIIGRELAKNLRAYLGDDLSIVSPFGGIGPSGPIPKSKPFRVAGIFYSGMFEYDTKYIYVSLPAAQKFFNQEGEVTGLELKLVDPDDTGALIARLEAALGPGFEVKDWKQMNRSLFSALKIEKILMFVILCFIVLVAAFSIIANGTMLVMEKGSEIAILKSMGASDAAVLGVFVMVGLMVGILGTVSGIGFGVMGCLALRHWGFPLSTDVFYLTQLPVKMNPYEIAVVFLATLAIALAATVYPAWSAARLRPVEALRDTQR